MTGTEAFYALPESEQVRRLQALATSALDHWSLGGAEVAPLAYRENMTFAVDAGGEGRFALRVHQAGYRTDAQVQSELDFMDYLRHEGVLTPQVVKTTGGASFVLSEAAAVPEVRQCDLFEWIDGAPLRRAGEPPVLSAAEAEEAYLQVGRLSASVFNASEKWQRPDGFARPRWDAEGIFGVHGHLGDFRQLPSASVDQLRHLEAIAMRVSDEIASFGKSPDRWGLSQADLLPENILVCEDGLRLIDFDDAGEGWALFDLVTSVWDLKLLGSELYEVCLRAVIAGFRERRALPDEHLALLPTFYFARLLSYLAHTVSRSHLEASQAVQQVILATLEREGAGYVAASRSRTT